MALRVVMVGTMSTAPPIPPPKSMKGFPDRSLTLTALPLGKLALEGRNAVVIGGTAGLGRAIARALASRGAKVTVVGRTFQDQGVAGLDFMPADLSSMREAQRVGRELPVDNVELVVLTTGIFAGPKREETAEGIERDTAVSYLSRYTVLRELAPRLASSPRRARIFIMGFPGAGELGDPQNLNAEREYDGMRHHLNTVAANEALVLELARRFPSLGVYGLNPGLIKTNIRANLFGEGSVRHRVMEFFIGLFTQSPERYASKLVPALFAPELERRTGAMLGAKANAILPTSGLDERSAAFAKASEELLARALK